MLRKRTARQKMKSETIQPPSIWGTGPRGNLIAVLHAPPALERETSPQGSHMDVEDHNPEASVNMNPITDGQWKEMIEGAAHSQWPPPTPLSPSILSVNEMEEREEHIIVSSNPSIKSTSSSSSSSISIYHGPKGYPPLTKSRPTQTESNLGIHKTTQTDPPNVQMVSVVDFK